MKLGNRRNAGDLLTGIAVVAAMVIVLALSCWWLIKHPCIEWRTDTCTSSDCVMHLTPGDVTSPCVSWHSRTYPCDVCVRRK